MTAILLAALLAGCGGGGQHHRVGDRPTFPVSAVSGPFRWLVRTTGTQPTVAVENRHRGTRAWRLPGPPRDVGGVRHGSLAGYVAEQAVVPGQRERIYVSAPRARFVRITVFRIGWYGGAGGREVLVADRLRTRAQPPCKHRYATGLTECNWHPTLTFTVPSALPSGVYVVKLADRRGENDCLFVVRSSKPQPLLAQLPTSTYEAYNAWGGDSLYPGGADRVGITGTRQGVEVSYDRPYDSLTGAGELFARDASMVWFLERYGYPVSYTTSESVDHDPSQAFGHRAAIDFGHSEYWSARQATAFAHARDAGTSLLFLSSDTLAWEVRYARASAASSEAGQPDHVIVSYKNRVASGRGRSQPAGVFPGRGAPLTGSAYVGCITPRLALPGPPTYSYYAWRPAPSLRPRWLFRRTRLAPTTRIPGIVGYELDMRTRASPRGTQLVGSGTASCMPPDSRGPRPGPGQDLAQTTLYTARSGALVFSSGTLGWELGLEPVRTASPDAPRAPDRRLVALTRNLLAHALNAARPYRPGR